MVKESLVRLVVAAVICVAAIGQSKVLVLKDGRSFEGDVTQTKEGYRVKTRMAVLIFPVGAVEKIIERSDPKDEYQRKLAKIDPNKAEDHVDLGQWAEKRGMMEEAKTLYEKALELHPNMELASLLLRRVKLTLAKSAGGETTNLPADPTSDAGSGVVNLSDLVTEEDIYRIRMGEYRPTRDTRVSVRFRNDALNKFIRAMRGVTGRDGKDFDENVFKRLSNAAKVSYIVDNTGWNDPIRNDILLRSDPEPLRQFRSTVWPKIGVTCGTVQCHGAPAGKGRLRLLTQVARNDRVDYSNFMILSQFTVGRWAMLDRQNPANSLLLTMGMNKKDVTESQGHPGKDEIPAIYPNTQSGAYSQMLSWLESLTQAPEGGRYGVTYTPPKAEVPEQEPVVPPPPVEAPATQPAATVPAVAPPAAPQIPPADGGLMP